MSWNAHTDHIFNQLPGQLAYLCLAGPDGSKWGESGNSSCAAQGGELAKAAGTPTGGLMGAAGKYMYLRSIDSFHCFNKSGKGAALYKGSTYMAVAFAAEGYKAEQCVTALEKLKTYLSGIGYN